MCNTSLVSIIIVTLNAGEFLQRCLDSIFSQKYPHLEVIVMDGGSTDKTQEILAANQQRLAFWKSEKDRGIYDAMNKAIGYARGEWIYFLGADDVLLPGFSEMAYELKDPKAIYYGSVVKAGMKYLGKMSDYQQAKTGINHQAIIYPAKLFSFYQYNLAYPISADHVLNMRCHKDDRYHFEYRDLYLAIFNDSGISSLQKDLLFEERKAKLILMNYGWSIYFRFQFKKLKERLK